MTQVAVAALAGVHVNTVSGIEGNTHKPCIETVNAIASSLKCDPYWLISAKGRQPKTARRKKSKAA